MRKTREMIFQVRRKFAKKFCWFRLFVRKRWIVDLICFTESSVPCLSFFYFFFFFFLVHEHVVDAENLTSLELMILILPKENRRWQFRGIDKFDFCLFVCLFCSTMFRFCFWRIFFFFPWENWSVGVGDIWFEYLFHDFAKDVFVEFVVFVEICW